MSDFLFQIYKYLTDVPFNIWFWLLIIGAPFCVFSVKPEKNVWIRAGRLLIAIGATYTLAILAIGTDDALEWKKYEACQSQFSDISHHEGCPLNVGSGASFVFFLFFGWIPATMYVGWWELAWRKYYRSKMISLRKGLGDDWFSNLVIIISFFTTLFGFIIFLIIIAALVDSVFIHPNFQKEKTISSSHSPIIGYLAPPRSAKSLTHSGG
ncbi:MAG: hypothetical protein U1E36_04920 [Rickettsiales bacterium]